jgi:NodT family efflux transporter outer membrane factor (OMF) lipoprotein
MKPYVLLSAAFLASCTVGPDYKMPDTVSSQKWVAPANKNGLVYREEATDAHWWENFQDPTLSDLIAQAIKNNQDIKIADANIRKARAFVKVESAAYYPDITAEGSTQREGLSKNNGNPVTSSPRYAYQAGFDANWELDLFGGVKRSVEAAEARYDATLENERGAMLAVMAEVARNYGELRGSQKKKAIIEKNIQLQKHTVDIVRQRTKVGEASEADLTRAEALLAGTEATLPNVTADIRTAAYRISVLTGQKPEALLDKLLKEEPLPVTKNIVPVGLRSDILRRRPDVRVAERELAAATADVGVATSDLFPKFFLTGGVGVQSIDSSHILSRDSMAWSFGPSIQWPIFRGGEIRAHINSTKAEVDASAARYEKAILTALEDTENALVRYGQEIETRERYEKVVSANQRALTLAQQRYKAGESDLLEVIDSERELSNAENSLVLSETKSFTNLVALYKSLGGGWEVW